MLYQPGDKVIVRQDLTLHNAYWMRDCHQGYYATRSMVALRGDCVIIAHSSPDGYKIVGTDLLADLWWTDEMFEGFAESNVVFDETIVEQVNSLL